MRTKPTLQDRIDKLIGDMRQIQLDISATLTPTERQSKAEALQKLAAASLKFQAAIGLFR
jgi:hypothetical protein